MEPGGWKEKRYRGRETLTDRQIQTERGRKSDAKRNTQTQAQAGKYRWNTKIESLLIGRYRKRGGEE